MPEEGTDALWDGEVVGVVEEQAGALQAPAMSVEKLCGILTKHGLVQSMARIRDARAER